VDEVKKRLNSFMRSNFFFHFFLFLFGFFIGNLFPTFFGQLIGSATSFFLLILFEFFHLITVSAKPSVLSAITSSVKVDQAASSTGITEGLKMPSSTNWQKRSIRLWKKLSQIKVKDMTGSKPFVDWLRFLRFESRPNRASEGVDKTMPRKEGKSNNYSPLQDFNSIKIGILFGLFVDAFKVGS